MAIEAQYKAEVWQNISATMPRFITEWPFRHIPNKGDLVTIENARYKIESVDYSYAEPNNPDPLLEIKVWVI